MRFIAAHLSPCRPLLLALTVLVPGFTALAAEPSGPVLQTPEKLRGTRNDIGGTIGNSLVIAVPRKIDKLGVFDAGGDGLKNPHEVGIWELLSGKLVVSATVPAGTEGELIEGFRYVKLSEPVELKGRYRIGALMVAGGDAFPDSVSGYEGVFLGGEGARLDEFASVFTRGDTLAPPAQDAGEGPGGWTGAARWAAANAYTTPVEPPTAEPDPAITPRIELVAEFTEKTRYALFDSGERVSLWIRVTGRRLGPDNLLWSVTDWKGDLVDQGTIPVPMPAEAELPGYPSPTFRNEFNEWQETLPLREIPPWKTILRLPDYGAGYFAVRLKLQKAGVTLPRLGSRPEGMVSYAVQPPIERLPLKYVDDSRFGAQGYATVASGEVARGNMVAPLYPAMGLRWVYGQRWFVSLERGYQPTLEKAARLWRDESDAGLCLLLSCITIPLHMQAAPPGQRSVSYSTYPPKDFDAWGKFIGKVARERAMVKQAGLFPTQKYNYYEIHWEPCGHYKGTDDDFMRMYEVAWKAIHDNDPGGRLLGPVSSMPGISRPMRLFEERLGPLGPDNRHVDGVSYHAYAAWPDRSMRAETRRLVAGARRYLKPGAKIVMTEVGTRDVEDWPRHPAPLRAQMANNLRMHLITLGEGVDTTFFFHLRDGDYGLFYNLTDQFPPFDATHLSPKPVGAAFAAATRLLEGTRTLGPLDFLGDDILCYTFQRGDQILAALWAADAAGSCEEPPRPVRVPVGAESVTFFDPMGNARQIKCENGYATIQVGAEPVYLLGLAPVVAPESTVTLAPGEAIPPEWMAAAPAEWALFQAGREVPLQLADGQTRLPLDIGGGEWLLSARQAGTGAWLGGAVIQVQPPFTLEAGPVDDTQEVKRVFTVANTSGQALNGRFEIRAVQPKNWASQVAEPPLVPEPGVAPLYTQALELLPGQSRTIEVEPAGLVAPSAKGVRLLAQFTDAYGRLRRVKAGASKGAVERCHAIPVVSPPTIDGDLRDWTLELFRTVDTRVDSRGGTWQDPADLSFRYAIQYDRDALYLAVKARDQSHVPHDPKGHYRRDYWEEDSLQVVLGVHPFTGGAGGDRPAPGLPAAATPANLGYAFHHLFAFALTTPTGGDKDAGFVWRFEGPDPFPRGKLDPGGIRFAGRRVGDETHYEIAIPWKEMDAQFNGPPAEKQLGFGLIVNDIDIEKGFKVGRKNMWAVARDKFTYTPGDLNLGVMELE